MEALSFGAKTVLEVIREYMVSFDHGYCYPSREQIRKKFLLHTGIEKSIRSIDYYNKELEVKQFIKRTRRNPKITNGTCEFKTTLYTLTEKAMKYIYKIASKLVRIAGKFFDRQLGRKKRDNKRFISHNPDEKRGSDYSDFLRFKETLKDIV